MSHKGPEAPGLRLNVTGAKQQRPPAKPRFDLWSTRAPAAVELVWKLHGGGLRAPDVGDALTREAVLRLTEPTQADRSAEWWRHFAVWPSEYDVPKIEGDWRRFGLVALLSYETGLRTHLEVWRNPKTKETQCVAPSWTTPAAWFRTWADEVGRWARGLWLEAMGRCFTAGVKLGPWNPSDHDRYYHRVWGVPRDGRWLGPNGWGLEIDDAERGRKAGGDEGSGLRLPDEATSETSASDGD